MAKKKIPKWRQEMLDWAKTKKQYLKTNAAKLEKLREKSGLYKQKRFHKTSPMLDRGVHTTPEQTKIMKKIVAEEAAGAKKLKKAKLVKNIKKAKKLGIKGLIAYGAYSAVKDIPVVKETAKKVKKKIKKVFKKKKKQIGGFIEPPIPRI